MKSASDVSPCSLRQVPPRTACVAGCQLCVLLRSKPVVFFIILSVQNRNNRIAQCHRSHIAPQIGAATTIGEYLRDRRLDPRRSGGQYRSEEHTSELQSLMRISYAVFCLKKKKKKPNNKSQFTHT